MLLVLSRKVRIKVKVYKTLIKSVDLCSCISLMYFQVVMNYFLNIVFNLRFEKQRAAHQFLLPLTTKVATKRLFKLYHQTNNIQHICSQQELDVYAVQHSTESPTPQYSLFTSIPMNIII